MSEGRGGRNTRPSSLPTCKSSSSWWTGSRTGGGGMRGGGRGGRAVLVSARSSACNHRKKAYSSMVSPPPSKSPQNSQSKGPDRQECGRDPPQHQSSSIPSGHGTAGTRREGVSGILRKGESEVSRTRERRGGGGISNQEESTRHKMGRETN
jgi:hypothetical protein